MPIAAGSQFGKYVVGKPLGRGGMAEVYSAWDDQLERIVALKILPWEIAADPLGLSRFVREARSASALNHPNIVTVYEIGHEDSVHFIAMEFVDGVTLRQWASDRAPELGEILALGAQAASALAAAHGAGIVHRDVKPENLMVRKDGYLKILDFGIAKPVSTAIENGHRSPEGVRQSHLRTSAGAIVGTVPYMSPEQARGLALDTRTDVWSLGVLLYELISGQRPFLGSTSAEIASAIVGFDPVPLDQLAPSLPHGLVRIVTTALSKRPDERRQTMAQIAGELDLLLAESDRSSALDATRRRLALPQVAGPLPPTVAGQTPASPLAPVRTNLPPCLAPLVGRDRERAEIARELRRTETRLLTLTGPGGTGKTRLALQAAADALQLFPDGVFFIDLSAVSDPALVAPAIAQSLGMSHGGGSPLLERVSSELRDKGLLLVLDNFEQLLEAAPMVGEIANRTTIKMLLTSRASLGLSMEREYAVPPLAVPDLDHLPDRASLERCDAVALFLERALAIRSDFRLTDENCRAVAEICVRLDGLPLAIELAVARLKLLSPRAMVLRLDERLALLTGGSRDLPDRQRTMRGEIAWSFDLLDQGEKKLFARLTVFVGSFTLEGAESVCFGAESEDSYLLDGLGSLVNKSLLRQGAEVAGDVRFSMLLTIREYGLERLSLDTDADAVRRRHAEYFRDLAERLAPDLKGADAVAAMARLDADHDNLRAALAWSLEHDPATALRTSAALKQFWDLRGCFAEGLAWLTKALARAPDTPSVERVRALQGAGLMSQYLGDYGRARPMFEQIVSMSKRMENGALTSMGLSLLAALAVLEGDYPAARSIYEETLEVATAAESEHHRLPHIFNNLGEVARAQGDLEAARSFYEQSLSIWSEKKNPPGTAVTIVNLGYTNDELGDDAAALDCHRRGVALLREIGDFRLIAEAIAGVASVAAKRGDAATAARLLGAAESLRHRFGSVIDPTDRALHERTIARIHASLGADRFTELRADGFEMTPDDAIAVAMAVSQV